MKRLRDLKLKSLPAEDKIYSGPLVVGARTWRKSDKNTKKNSPQKKSH